MERLNHTITRFSSLRAKSPLSCSPPDRKVLLRILKTAAPCLMIHTVGLTNPPTHQSRATPPRNQVCREIIIVFAGEAIRTTPTVKVFTERVKRRMWKERREVTFLFRRSDQELDILWTKKLVNLFLWSHLLNIVTQNELLEEFIHYVTLHMLPTRLLYLSKKPAMSTEQT